MTKYFIEINITEDQIRKAVDSAGKLDRWAITRLATTVVENKIKTKMRKAVGDLDAMVDAAISDLDWNKIIIERMSERLSDPDY
jgi:hypothetical protein